MKGWEMLCEESLMNATGYAAYFCKLLKLKTWKALILQPWRSTLRNLKNCKFKWKLEFFNSNQLLKSVCHLP